MRQSTRKIRPTFGRAILFCTLIGAAAAGCSDAHPGATGTPTTKTPGGHISTANPEPSGKRTPLPTSVSYKVSTPPGSSKGYVGAAQDVKLSTCNSSKAATTFAGTVTNSTGAAQSYRIYVAVTLKSATVGIDEVDVNALAARSTSNWHGSLGTGADGATCVLRVERTQQV